MPSPHKKRNTNRSNHYSKRKQIPRDRLDALRYGKNWSNRQWKQSIHQATNRLCPCCMKNKTEAVHHLRYTYPDGSPVKDRETVPTAVIAVCNECHSSVCHKRSNWFIHPVDPMLDRNTDEFQQWLIGRWKQARSGKVTAKPVVFKKPTKSKQKSQTSEIGWAIVCALAIVLLVWLAMR